MHLVNMDVDQYGTQQRCHLGPLSPGLNAVCGPKGSGKSTLLSWLRQVTAESYAPDSLDSRRQPIQTPVSGTVEIRHRHGGFRASSDRHGRVKYEPINATRNGWASGDRYQPYNLAARADVGLTASQREAFQGLAAASGGGDTQAALGEVARRLGLDIEHSVVDKFQSQSAERSSLLAREAELQSRLGRLDASRTSHAELLQRRADLEQEITRLRASRTAIPASDRLGDLQRLDYRVTAIEQDLQSHLAEIESLDREIAEQRAELKLCETNNCTVDIDESYRHQLQQLDDRLNRWRQTLRDLKSHRERIEHDATDTRLDKQIGEQLSSTKVADPRAAMRALEAQVLSTRKQLDELVGRYGGVETARTGSSDYEVVRDASGQTRITYTDAYRNVPEAGELPSMLRSMQKDLYEVCQQLARQESQTAFETLKTQAQQLARCETELLHAVEKLIEERALLLRRIADRYNFSVEQLTLAFGEWCQCHDHPHLHDWLLREEKHSMSNQRFADAGDRNRISGAIESLLVRRRNAQVHVDDCHRQLHDTGAERRYAPTAHDLSSVSGMRRESDLATELDAVNRQLRDCDEPNRLRSELDEVRRQLAHRVPTTASHSPFQANVDRHIATLVGRFSRADADRSYRDRAGRRYDPVDGVVVDGHVDYETYEKLVPESLVRLAMRLAIAEEMQLRGEPISLMLDEALDGLQSDQQQRVVSHLASVSATGQQIVLLTSDERVASMVREHGGWVGYMHRTTPPIHGPVDINRSLAAIANDHEADKWYSPGWANTSGPAERRFQSRNAGSDYYLTEHSLIEESPSIDPTAAARCRAVGVDRVGDLQDVDPAWLAESLRLRGVTAKTVTRWQAESRLLCSVRKLLPFDARVLVGAGIRTPRQLAETRPADLLESVERFLTTDYGRRILNSGSSRELSRITTWIAAAKSGRNRFERTSIEDDYADHDYADSGYRAYEQDEHESGDYESGHYERREYDHGEYELRESDAERGSSRRSDGSSSRSRSRTSRSGSSRRGSSRISSGSRNTSRRSSSRRGGSSERAASNGALPRSSTRQNSGRSYPVLRDSESEAFASRNGNGRSQGNGRAERESSSGWEQRGERVRLVSETAEDVSAVKLKFYLELSSPVVDAPSIGPRMAARLEKVGVFSVDQLLVADAEELADKLNNRRVEGDTVRAWQAQAELVCRIPNLRGHDAQLLVACELTSPEDLAQMDPQAVLGEVVEYARTSEGQRVLRGSKEPDLAEITDWIAWAASSRNLNAA